MLRPRVFRYVVITTLLWVAMVPGSRAQGVRGSLFMEADNVMETARTAKADLLAPKSYSRAMTYYREAETKLDRGKNLDDIRKDLSEAVRSFRASIEAAKLAEVTLSAGIQARADAEKAQAVSYAPVTWQEAERKFAEAARRLEDGDMNGSKSRVTEATSMFRNAELEAIKGNLLNETRTLIAQAERDKVREFAPKTLEAAKNSLQLAEKELTDNRYDTDVARGVARQAYYEAKHAVYLAGQIRQVKDKKKSLEDMALEWEEPLRQIAASVELAAEFDAGWKPLTEEILTRIAGSQRDAQKLQQDLNDREIQILDLQMQVSGLESSLGGATEEQLALKQHIEEQARVREKFQRVENLFQPEEAHVLRDGDDVIIRLLGLTFDVGRSTIKPDQFALLTKVQQAIDIFPYSAVVVEGHTDSYGGDELNLKLSEERAGAVRQYFIANFELRPEDVEAVGFGESRPIANNETPEGRGKNRRIDVVIKTYISR